jgi:signal transduction histidine kinase
METSLFLLRTRAGADERVGKHLDRISDQLRLADGIISDLLDMVRDQPLRRQRVRLAAVAAEAAAAVERPAEVRLEIQGLERLPDVDGDPGQLRQVFVNLLSNAVHAAGPRGRVRVVDAGPGADVAVAVEDDGPGVEESVRARLFEPLVTTKPTGIGLGLSLVRRIAERHGGSVSYEPRREGGARFTIRLPRA